MNNFLILAATKKESSFSPLALLLILVVIALIIWAIVRANGSKGPRHIDSGFSVDADDVEMESFGFVDDNQTFGEPPPSGDARMDALAKAVDLYGKGFLTDEEFNAEKQRILGE
jgi:putative oligomerization/nucleic acid binding protein